MDPVVVTRATGLSTTSALRAAGCSEYSITAAVRSGRFSRVRRGWYTTLDEMAPQVVAVRHGGVLTGISALHHHGAWILEKPTRLHVAVPAHASVPGPDSRVRLHWENPSEAPSAPEVAGFIDSLVRVALDEPVEVSVPCFDWALASGRIDRMDYERAFLRLPPALHPIRYLIDPASQSILESVARVRLLMAGWKVRSQIRVGDSGAIDLVVEDHVALELDGREFHESTFERDRRKDLAIAIEGRHSIRISMTILRSSWAEVERAIAGALAPRRRGDAGKSGKLITLPKRRLRARGIQDQLS